MRRWWQQELGKDFGGYVTELVTVREEKRMENGEWGKVRDRGRAEQRRGGVRGVRAGKPRCKAESYTRDRETITSSFSASFSTLSISIIPHLPFFVVSPMSKYMNILSDQ